MTEDHRSPNQKAISQGLKFAWKRKKAHGGWHVKEPETMTAAEYRVRAKKPKRPKYGNSKIVVDGVTIDSRREARRWTELQIMERAGLIRDLQRQPVYILAPAVKIAGEARKRPALRVTLDFRYVEAKTGEIVCEDVKSPSTAKAADWRMRQHLMATVHGISVRVIL